MTTKLSLDSNLVEQVLELSGALSKNAAVTKALEEFVARRKQKGVLELFGKLEWNNAYDHKVERSRNKLILATLAREDVDGHTR